MPIELQPDFNTALRHPHHEGLCTVDALEQKNQRLREVLAKAEQWGGGLEAINGAAQAQLTIQNIAYAGAIEQLNVKEKKRL
ncbi:hypothetical protein FRB94_000894 [Tulasnella sp. JGI-2019a]|nr:hypothetical protein FRB94_000894 [Tulasnella sp. JGI-2019a]